MSSSNAGRVFRYLRSPRRAAEIALGVDGRPLDETDAPDAVDPEAAAEAAEAADVLARAREQAAALIAEASREATAIQDDAYRDGRDQGYRDGVMEARGELAEALAIVQRIGQEAHAVRDRVLWNAEREVIELVIGIAETVIGEQVAIEPALVLDIVERALTRAGAQNVVRIRVNPEDRETVWVAMAERHGDDVPFQVLGDHAVAVGGCVVDTEAGEIDARLDVQLAEVARVLRSAVPDAGDATGARAAWGDAGIGALHAA